MMRPNGKVQTRFSLRFLLVVALLLGGTYQLPLVATRGPAAGAPATQSTFPAYDPSRRGGTLIVAYDEEPRELDFPRAGSTASRVTFNSAMGDTLVYLDKNGKLQPWLARSWEQKSSSVYIFRIRAGVRFHDGTPLDAAAVKFNLDRLVKVSPRRPLFPIASTEVVDPLTVQVNLTTPMAPFVAHMTDPITAMMSPAVVQSKTDDELTSLAVGTGPFKFVEWVRGDHITVEANNDYWQGRPYLDRIIFRLVPDPQARTAQLQAGDAHMGTTLVEAQFTQLQRMPGFRIENHGSTRHNAIGMDRRCAPLGNRFIRQAIAHAIDANSIVKNVLLGVGEPNNQWMNRGTFGWSPKVLTYEYNPKKSRELLARSGYPDGFNITLTHSRVSGQPWHEAVQAQLAAVGIKVRLEQLESAAFAEKRDKEGYCLWGAGWGAIYNDADFDLYSSFHSSSIPPRGPNSWFLKDPQIDRLLDEARKEFDLKKREALYWRLNDILAQRLLFVPVTRVNYVNGWSTKVRDVYQNAGDQWWFGRTWLTK